MLNAVICYVSQIGGTEHWNKREWVSEREIEMEQNAFRFNCSHLWAQFSSFTRIWNGAWRWRARLAGYCRLYHRIIVVHLHHFHTYYLLYYTRLWCNHYYCSQQRSKADLNVYGLSFDAIKFIMRLFWLVAWRATAAATAFGCQKTTLSHRLVAIVRPSKPIFPLHPVFLFAPQLLPVVIKTKAHSRSSWMHPDDRTFDRLALFTVCFLRIRLFRL